MTYTENYYAILGLAAPSLLRSPSSSSSSSDAGSAAEIRRAYREALFRAHPDKAAACGGRMETWNKKGGVNMRRTEKQVDGKGAFFTVDQVKEAFSVLGDVEAKKEYDRWFFSVKTTQRIDNLGSGHEDNFVLGLEVLDLADFDAISRPASPASREFVGVNENREAGEEEGRMEWVRACRCGAEKGFRITEEELESAEARGEKEVLVGCEGCSLWVRVGFEVNEG